MVDASTRATVTWNGEVVSLRLMHDWVCLLLLPEKKEENGIILPDSCPSDIRSGVVMARGPGMEGDFSFRAEELLVGDVVFFHRWNLEHKQGKLLSQQLDPYTALIRARDILVVKDEE